MLFIVENLEIDIPSNATRVALAKEIIQKLPKQEIVYKNLSSLFYIPQNKNKIPAILGIKETKENASLIYRLSLNYDFKCDPYILKYGEIETLKNYMKNFFTRETIKNKALLASKDKINVNAGHLILTGVNAFKVFKDIEKGKIENGYTVFSFDKNSVSKDIEALFEEEGKIFVFFNGLPSVEEKLINELFNKKGGVGLRVVLAIDILDDSPMCLVFKDNCNAVIENN